MKSTNVNMFLSFLVNSVSYSFRNKEKFRFMYSFLYIIELLHFCLFCFSVSSAFDCVICIFCVICVFLVFCIVCVSLSACLTFSASFECVAFCVFRVPKRMTNSFKEEVFGWHYGLTPLVVSTIWFDLQQGGYLSFKQNTLKGFKLYMLSMFYLWVYPKNSGIMATRFRMNRKYCYGAILWHWVGKLADLFDEKVVWDDYLGDEDKSPLIGSIDCTDCKIWEKCSHHIYNIDKSLCSQKTNSAALKYEVVLDINKSKVLSVVGPVKACEHDMNVFHLKTKARVLQMPRGKRLIADGIYKPGKDEELNEEEKGLISIPRSTDDKGLKAFMSQVRARHESFNWRLKFFGFLGASHKGVDFEKHGKGFRSICAIVQYQMDNGSPLFDSN